MSDDVVLVNSRDLFSSSRRGERACLVPFLVG